MGSSVMLRALRRCQIPSNMSAFRSVTGNASWSASKLGQRGASWTDDSVSQKAGLQHRPFIRRFLSPNLTDCRPYSSGSSSHQWRKLKNQWLSNKAPFPPSCGSGKKKRLIPQLAHTAGPTCLSQLAEEASDKLEFLPPWDSIDQDLLLLYGQYGSTLVNHMDVEKASEIEESETSFLDFHLPSSYLCFVCSAEEFNLSNPETPPK